MKLTDKYGRTWIFKRGTYTLVLSFFCIVVFSQSNIVASGHENYTVGSDLVQMQISEITVVKDPVLSVPKYEYPIEQPKPIVEKKKSFWQKLIVIIKNLFK